ncbi:DUF1501 domain-containing protein [Verrucomicrobiaceae bacterium 5K15]|uniref:DUF1501 domain-containing protein n=1 Tax=Oceaniferula flava TaxID=2800421 RepID=A0AAE2VBF4_9BACT|nr:DUF1501 domain-containing protein [Oceaniferula flavus]MBK1853691.1 DUF1501 domain-containing protein [Oceaniferula flavus]MBM1134997.1 DUF1501 domain-containing protein [Oceaniferula flavus]
MSRNLSRRRFLGEASCAALGSTSILSTILNLQMANNAVAGTGDGASGRKTLVCLFLSGGCDSYNVLLPADTSPANDGAYDDYAAARSNLALSHPDKAPVIFNPDAGTNDQIANPNFLPLNTAEGGAAYTDSSGRSYGIHPSCTRLKELFEGTSAEPNKKRLSFISNIGTLVEPIADKSAYESGNLPLPKALFSHSDQTEQWQTSVPQGQTILSGWAGRAADILHSRLNTEQTNGFYMPMNFSINGNTVFQTGATEGQFVLTSNGALSFSGPHGTANDAQSIKNRTLKEMATDPMNEHYRNLFQQAFRKSTADSIERGEQFQTSFDAPGSVNGQDVDAAIDAAGFLDDYLGNQLRAAVRTIAIRETLKLCRQTLFIEYGGWDNHSELLNTQAALLSSLDTNLYAYQNCLEALGLGDDVITFTSSDFARTLRSNGQGTDHAWSGNQFVLGSPVDGGKIVGNYASLAIDGPDDIGRGGRIFPKVSVDEYFCELLDWFGVAQGEMGTVLPNIENFHTLGAVNRPLGFIS